MLEERDEELARDREDRAEVRGTEAFPPPKPFSDRVGGLVEGGAREVELAARDGDDGALVLQEAEEATQVGVVPQVFR